MRLTFVVALLFIPAQLSAQSSPCTASSFSLLQFDPYKPSDVAVVRNYGGALLAQAPLEALLKLDPYVPTEGALLRQLGSAIPFWAYTEYPFYRPASDSSPCAPVPTTPGPIPEPEPAARALATFDEMLAALDRGTPAAAPTPTRTQSARRSNSGITIQYGGRTWVSDGPARRIDEAELMRIGEQAGSPIFRRRIGREDTVIYIPTTGGLVAPFRVVP